MDDIAYDFKLPHKIAFLIGAKFSPIFKDIDFSFEYVRINQFTYAYNLGNNNIDKEQETMLRYVFYGRKNDFNRGSIIGHYLGPDTDLGVINFWGYLNKIIINVEVQVKRKGEGNILEPALIAPSSKPKAIFLGTVEKTLVLNFKIYWLKSFRLLYKVDFGIISVINQNHRRGLINNRFNFTISIQFDPVINLLQI